MNYCAAGGRSQRCLNYEWGVQGAEDVEGLLNLLKKTASRGLSQEIIGLRP